MAASSSPGIGMDQQTLDSVSCDDYLQFQNTLKNMRAIDDKIIYQLNETLPTDYFAKKLDIAEHCKSFYEQLNESHERRRLVINKCLKESAVRVNQRKEEQEKDKDNFNLIRNLRNEQRKLRLVQQEVNIEEIIKDRTIKAYYERCRDSYKPPIDRPIV